MLSTQKKDAAAVIPALADVQGGLSTGDAAKLLGVSRSTVMKLVVGGLLPAFRLGMDSRSHHRISADALRAYVSRAAR